MKSDYSLLLGLGVAWAIYNAYNQGLFNPEPIIQPKSKKHDSMVFMMISTVVLIHLVSSNFSDWVNKWFSFFNEIKVKCCIKAEIPISCIDKNKSKTSKDCEKKQCAINNKFECDFDNFDNYDNYDNFNKCDTGMGSLINKSNCQNNVVDQTKAIKISSDSLANDNVIVYKVVADGDLDDDLPNILNLDETSCPRININKLEKHKKIHKLKHKNKKPLQTENEFHLVEISDEDNNDKHENKYDNQHDNQQPDIIDDNDDKNNNIDNEDDKIKLKIFCDDKI
jgi:hypothetical protein